ncbi:MAG: hypothetical protein J5525_13200 [Lachnospiraceae bacterium]|nr:hypothetical protein [Lachnospiraceae bacterium]
MFGKKKLDLTQNYYSPFADVMTGKLYDEGKITEAQYLNSLSLSFGIFTVYNEKGNKNIEDNILRLEDNRNNVIEFINRLDNMSPEEKKMAALEKTVIKSYSMTADDCKTTMEMKKALYFTNLGMLYVNLEGIFSPDTVNTPVSGMSDDVLEDIYLAATCKEAIAFIKNDPDLFKRTSVFEYKDLSLDERGEYIKQGKKPPMPEKIVKNTYEDFISKEAFKNAWEIAKRMRNILTLTCKSDIDIYSDPRFFDENGFLLTEDGRPVETRLEAHYRGIFLRKLVDTKGYENLFGKI